MKTIPIDEASEDQLRVFARDTLGIEIKSTAKIETVRARVLSAWEKPEIVVQDDEPATVSASPPVTAKQQDPDRKMVRLILGVTEDAGGNDPVQVGVNGKIMLIPRGEECEIPESYFEVLQHAVTHKFDPLPDGGMNPIPRKVPLYPYQRLDHLAA